MRFVRPFQVAWRFLRRPRVFDNLLVGVLGGITLLVLIAAVPTNRPLVAGAACYLAGILPLLIRRKHPLVATAIIAVIDAIGLLSGIQDSSNIAEAIAFYSAGRYTSGRTTVIATVAGTVFYGVVFEVAFLGNGAWVGGGIQPLIMVGLGQLVRVRAELKDRRLRELADTAVRAERRRIARELHDVVAHHLSVVNALVGGARATLPPEQEVARDALSSAEQTARRALAEMRQLLDVLRADDGGPADASTGVGTARLPAL
ncbi:MAG: histidine kinase, partial [Nonomuraea sp.]|nr:histidine kinase [Nonomuraea sp.]